MNVTGMLYGARKLAHVDFPASEVLGSGATEDQIQDLIDHLNRGRNMDTRTPQEQCAFVV